MGRDAVDLLGRLSTNDLAPLREGSSVSTLFLSPTGRMLHRVLLHPCGGELRALAGPQSRETLPAWVERYTFAEDARLDAAPDLAAIEVVGAELLGNAAAPLPATGACVVDGALAWCRRDLGPVPAAVVTGPHDEVRALASRLGEPMDDEARLQLRVELGLPGEGAEVGEDYFPLEARLAPEVSFTKGCYTGQEVVARQDSYGKVSRRLVILAFERAPAPGEILSSEENAGCRVTSVAPRPVEIDGNARALALGFVRTRSMAPGTRVTTASGQDGVVVPTPE